MSLWDIKPHIPYHLCEKAHVQLHVPLPKILTLGNYGSEAEAEKCAGIYASSFLGKFAVCISDMFSTFLFSPFVIVHLALFYLFHNGWTELRSFFGLCILYLSRNFSSFQ